MNAYSIEMHATIQYLGVNYEPAPWQHTNKKVSELSRPHCKVRPRAASICLAPCFQIHVWSLNYTIVAIDAK